MLRGWGSSLNSLNLPGAGAAARYGWRWATARYGRRAAAAALVLLAGSIAWPGVGLAARAAESVPAAELAPADSLVVTAYYFHRTFRCETCIHMEEVITSVLAERFSAETAGGRLRWTALDYEDEAHAPLYASYGLKDGPAFVLSRRLGEREESWLELAKIWEQTDQPERLTEYLASQIRRSLRPVSEPSAGAAPSLGAGGEGGRP